MNKETKLNFSRIEQGKSYREEERLNSNRHTFVDKIISTIKTDKEDLVNYNNQSFANHNQFKKDLNISKLQKGDVKRKRNKKFTSQYESLSKTKKQPFGVFNKTRNKDKLDKSLNMSFMKIKSVKGKFGTKKFGQRDKSAINKFKKTMKEGMKYKKNFGGQSQAKQKSSLVDIDREEEKYNRLYPDVLFKTEEILYEIYMAIVNKKDIYDLFKVYMDYIQDYEYDGFIEILTNEKLAEEVKKGLILERVSLMILFYFLINEQLEKNLASIQSLIYFVYSNFHSFVSLIAKDPNGKKWLKVC